MATWDALIGTTVNTACAFVLEATINVATLSHLEGQVVSILANGEVLDEQTVSSGTVTLADYYSLIRVGLPYYADLETLPIEVPLKGSGTIQGLRTKISNVTFFLKDSLGGWLGPDDDDLWNAFTTEAINQYSGDNIGAYDLYTGKVRFPMVGEYVGGGSVFYRQVDPLPVTIGAIMPEVDIGGQSR